MTEAKIWLYGKIHTRLDFADYRKLFAYEWNLSRKMDGRLYAVRSERRHGKNVMIYMHREIMEPPTGMVVDHINGDGLDNRRSNLRVCSQSENASNRRMQENNTSGYRGVSRAYNKKSGRDWKAFIKVKGKTWALGRFYTVEEAARAYDRAAWAIRPDYARLNFPERYYINRRSSEAGRGYAAAASAIPKSDLPLPF